MNERRSLHPMYIVYSLFQVIKGLWPLLLLGVIRGTFSELGWYLYAGAGALLLVTGLHSFFSWKRFGFWLEHDRIVIRKGVLFRDEKTIYFTRIHSVNVEQSLLHRLLRIAQVKIETPGGNKKADGILTALSLPDANDIKELLRRHADDQQRAHKEPEEGGAPAVQADPDTTGDSEHAQPAAVNAERQPDDKPTPPPLSKGASFRLDTGMLLKAAATSTNFGLVAAFLGAAYSLGNDLIEPLLPGSLFVDFIEDSVTGFSKAIVLFVVIACIGFLAIAWILSILLYILKYSGFEVRREGEQISVSYGLLEKKSFLFDPKKVQAVIVEESFMRQPLGYAQVQLQVVSSAKQEVLLLHPFIKRSEVQTLLDSFVSRLRLPQPAQFTKAPKRAMFYYVRFPMLFAIIVCSVLIVFFKTNGLWSLPLLPLVFGWGYGCHRTAGILLEDGQLSLQSRFVSRSTYLIRKPQILTMSVKRSIGQEKKKVASLLVHALGSPMAKKAAYMDRADIEPVWRWYSRTGRMN